jgi:hypothetical protein
MIQQISAGTEFAVQSCLESAQNQREFKSQAGGADFRERTIKYVWTDFAES